MSQNPGKDPEIVLEVFAGIVTNQDPISLPQGASPDCTDVAFLPGGVTSRPALQKIFANPVYPGFTMTYGKSYVDPKGVIRNLYLYSNGGMTIELPQTSPGIEHALLDNLSNPVFLPAGSFMKSITAFGREYLACANGLHGAEVPLQYDGTFLDRVTQDGPGSSPTVVSLPLPPVGLIDSGAPLMLTITGIFPTNKVTSGGVSFYTAIGVFVTTTVAGISVGQSVTISGTAGARFAGTYLVLGFPGDGSVQLSAFFPDGTLSYTGSGTLTVGSGSGTSLVRNNNIVTAVTTGPHQLQVGYLAQIAGVPASSVGGGISTIVINNEDNPGVATVTTSTPHGLIPELFVSLTGIAGTAVGGGTSAISRQGQVVTVTTSAPHGLTPGAIVTLSGFSDTTFNTTAQVLNVTGPDVFTFPQADADATDTTGVVTINWPFPDTSTPTDFEVLTAPTPTTFQVAVDYSNGSWTGGTVSYAWDGKFYVATVPSPTTFTYQQYGPNAAATYSSNSTVTPFGQAAPGFHQMQVLFITRQGYATVPSPPVTFIANGGQYYSVSNIPIGPSNVVARAIAFTLADGAYFFYIPSTPQVNGQIVGTSTVINDNTTTQAVFDFGDPTLAEQNTQAQAGAISIQGNNLANQIILDGALGFGFYASRLFTYGQRNVVDNLLNMSFAGGYLPNSSTIYGSPQPTGWTVSGTTPGQLVTNVHFGDGYQFGVIPSPTGGLVQPGFEDSSGDPILLANTLYRLRVWIKTSAVFSDVNFIASIQSTSTGFISAATVPGHSMSTTGGFVEVVFAFKTPVMIPQDMILNFYVNSSGSTPNVTINNASLIYDADPYLTGMFASYTTNPEGMDGVSGVIGPVEDTHQVMDLGIIRDNLYMLTQDPSGRLHQTAQGLTEPADWVVSEVAANCGAVSSYSSIRSQADDSSAAGGEEFWGWYSSTGIRLFGGQEPFKISQEIQRPIGQQFPGAPFDLGALNTAAQLSVWGLNDPQSKTMWWGIPVFSGSAPNVIYMLSYLGLDSAEAISASPPVHRSLSGHMVANDLARKWSPWQRPMNGAALMYRNGTDIQPVFFAGNGVTPGVGGLSNAYTLNPNLYTDDDYGQIVPYYITSAFPDKDAEQALGLGGGFKMMSWMRAMFYGVGYMDIGLLVNYLNNPWLLDGTPAVGHYLMSLTPLRGAPWACAQATGDLMFIKFGSVPNPAGTTANPATDNQFSLSRLSVWMRKNSRYLDPGVWP